MVAMLRILSETNFLPLRMRIQQLNDLWWRACTLDRFINVKFAIPLESDHTRIGPCVAQTGEPIFVQVQCIF